MKKFALYILLLFISMGYAQTIFQDNFNNYTVNTQLTGQGSWTNNSSNGGTGACTGALCVNAKVLVHDKKYISLKTNKINSIN